MTVSRIERESIPMINIYLTGQIAQKRRINTYVRSILTYLMPRLRRDIDIYINVTKECDDGAYGLCWGDRNEVEIHLSRETQGVKIPLEEMMQTLAHELVHAKQFIKGDLSPMMRNSKTVYHAKTPYSRQPWELEAYRKEERLLQTFWL